MYAKIQLVHCLLNLFFDLVTEENNTVADAHSARTVPQQNGHHMDWGKINMIQL